MLSLFIPSASKMRFPSHLPASTGWDRLPRRGARRRTWLVPCAPARQSRRLVERGALMPRGHSDGWCPCGEKARRPLFAT